VATSLPRISLIRSPDSLRKDRDESRWRMFQVVDPERREIVGSAGYKRLSGQRVIEIGFQVTPAHRRRGYATAAARELIARVFAEEDIDAIEAESLAAENASVRILRACGFTRAGEAHAADGAQLWRWRLERRLD
jgi:ribosomal-protein-alanine N-acetyltransferase